MIENKFCKIDQKYKMILSSKPPYEETLQILTNEVIIFSVFHNFSNQSFPFNASDTCKPSR